jgi:hypothetical protein
LSRGQRRRYSIRPAPGASRPKAHTMADATLAA